MLQGAIGSGRRTALSTTGTASCCPFLRISFATTSMHSASIRASGYSIRSAALGPLWSSARNSASRASGSSAIRSLTLRAAPSWIWNVNHDALASHAREVATRALAALQNQGISDFAAGTLFAQGQPQAPDLRTLPPEEMSLLLKNSISPLPLHKTLLLLDILEQHRCDSFYSHERLALAAALVSRIGNLHFGPEVGVRRIQKDAPVIGPWLDRIRMMSNDLSALREQTGTEALVHLGDAREPERYLEPSSIDVVITSPPYPNEKDYTRTTRLESVLLGFYRDKRDLRSLKQGLVRSNTRSVYKADADDALVSEHEGIQEIAHLIEARRR